MQESATPDQRVWLTPAERNEFVLFLMHMMTKGVNIWVAFVALTVPRPAWADCLTVRQHGAGHLVARNEVSIFISQREGVQWARIQTPWADSEEVAFAQSRGGMLIRVWVSPDHERAILWPRDYPFDPAPRLMELTEGGPRSAELDSFISAAVDIDFDHRGRAMVAVAAVGDGASGYSHTLELLTEHDGEAGNTSMWALDVIASLARSSAEPGFSCGVRGPSSLALVLGADDAPVVACGGRIIDLDAGRLRINVPNGKDSLARFRASSGVRGFDGTPVFFVIAPNRQGDSLDRLWRANGEWTREEIMPLETSIDLRIAAVDASSVVLGVQTTTRGSYALSAVREEAGA